uniref:Uncharacterized protein n=1 Tax=Yersinia enterocolitica TaxID=630 RepID=B0RKQ2_YEREN|nr:hypothetical protein [Yersinia enterocolitica]
MSLYSQRYKFNRELKVVTPLRNKLFLGRVERPETLSRTIGHHPCFINLPSLKGASGY